MRKVGVAMLNQNIRAASCSTAHALLFSVTVLSSCFKVSFTQTKRIICRIYFYLTFDAFDRDRVLTRYRFLVLICGTVFACKIF